MCRLGAHWHHTGDYVRAQAAYSEALRIEPKHLACWLNLAVTQIRLGSYEAAGDTLEDSLRDRRAAIRAARLRELEAAER